MKYDFNRVFPQPGNTSPMHKKLQRQGIFEEDAVDYGTAEMKFEMLPEIQDGIIARVKSGFLGYSTDNSDYLPALQRWMKVRHDWDIEPEWVVNTHGVVTSIGIAMRAFTQPGDKVIVQSPVYDHFASEVVANGRVPLENPLIRNETGYEIDFDDFEAKAKQPDVTAFVLCSPHNPVGRVWTAEELTRLAKICVENNVFVVADEIHHDIVYGREQTIFIKTYPGIEKLCIMSTAPSKTFNIPGLALSNIIIPDEEVREKFKAEAARGGHYMNTLAMGGAAQAYLHGDEWVDEMNAYVASNAKKLREWLHEYIPEAWMPVMEGTYLAWIDFGFLGLSDEELPVFFREKAKVAINAGSRYGTGSHGFMRVNIGCPEKYVLDFVKKTAAAIAELKK